MESGDGGASRKGVLVPVPDTSDEFQTGILAPLKSAYLYEDSKQSFKYNSAFLVKNPELEKKYNAFRAKKKAAGYSEEDLKESFGFLLFDDVNKANSLGKSGLLTGNGTCTTLGDPSDGVYISMYSDCLDINRWYHGKSGYIAIIRLTKGRVKKVSENYTQDFTAPTAGFDCHVSDQLPSVSDKTSSFLAFERTQYYTYELLDDGSNKTAQSPSAACPHAIVSFSYTDTKAAHLTPQEDREEKKQIYHYFTWRGQLQICNQVYDARLRSTSGALIPAQLPPVVKTDRAISMLNLRQMLPKAVFETCASGEVFQDRLWFSICEFVSSEVEETDSLSLLLSEVKEKDVAFTVLLNDGGFLFLVHSSHFLTYDDTGSSVTEVLRGVFVFPDSRVVHRELKSGHRKPHTSSEILRILPVLSYAESEVEKAPVNPSEDLSEVLTQHMQSYAALINPGLDVIPSREVSIFADQYDVPDAHKHLYTSPEWTERAWQSLKSYLSNPVSFQLPLAKASEILMAGHENQVEDFDDDVYICLSSPEEALDDTAAICSKDQLEGQTSINIETTTDGVEAPFDLRSVSLNVVPDDLQADKDSKKSEQSKGIKTDIMRTNNLLIPSTSDELPAELIVSITSAERTHECMICNESATKQNDAQISAKAHTARVNPLNDETVESKKILDSHGVNSLKTKHRRAQRGCFKVSDDSVETHILPTEQTPVENENSESLEDNLAKAPEDQQWLSNPPNTYWRKVRKRKRIFGKLSTRSKKMKHFTVGPASSVEGKKDPKQQNLESTFLMELEAFPLRRKIERWDLKPVVSTCGRILIPHGFVLVAEKIKSLQDQLQSVKHEKSQEKMSEAVEMVQKSNSVQDTKVDKTENASFKDGEKPLNDVSFSRVSAEQSIFKQLDVGCDSSKVIPESGAAMNDVTNTSPFFQAVQEKNSNPLVLGKCSPKGEFLLSKLKSVLLRGKRKMDLLGSEEAAEDTGKATELCPKRSNVDSETSIVNFHRDKVSSVEDADLGLKEVSTMLSVDPLFAHALGLTPKAIPKMVKKTDSSQTQEETMLDKEPKIIKKPPSIFPRKGRIKTLKKHQDVSAENVKKKWWLHFQTPASYASDKLSNKECTRNNSVRKAVKERLSSACPSTDALTLLADLALSASHDQVPIHPDSALGRQPETSLKKCDLTKDVTSVDQESVLHALLRQPAFRSTQPVKSPSPSHLVGGSELVDLVSREHAYSLPPSSSLPLGLPGTPLQVSPLSGSAGLLHHQKTMYDDGSKQQHLSVVQKDEGELNPDAPAYMKKHITRRRKFKHSRTFTSKDSSIQVTKQWGENYDFSRDSKFASDPMDKAIGRALHGPWDHSVQDTNEEVRLIVHMWIGLFYSRSTARFFQVDLDSTNSCSEESNALEKPGAMVSSSDQSEFRAKSDESLPSVTNISDPLTVKALDLSKKDQGTVILDLSLKNSVAEVVMSDPQVNKKETSVPSEWKETSNQVNTQSSKRQQEVCKEIMLSTKFVNGMFDVRGFYKNIGACTPLQQATMLSCGNAALIPVQKACKSVFLLPCLTPGNADKMDMKPVTGNSKTTETSLVQPPGEVTSKSIMDHTKKEVDNVVLTVHRDDIESKDEKNLEVNKKLLQEDDIEPCPKAVQPCGDVANKESGNLDENEKCGTSEGHKALSQSKAISVTEDVCRSAFTESIIEDESFGKKDRLGGTDTFVSAVIAKSDVNDQPSSVVCAVPDSAKKDIAKLDGHTKSDELPDQADKKEEALHDIQSSEVCADNSVLTAEHTITEKALQTPQQLEADLNKPASEDSLPQTDGSTETGSKDKAMTSCSQRSDGHEDCDSRSVIGEKMAGNQTWKEPLIHQSDSSQREPMEPETEIEETKDLTSGEENEGLGMSNNRVIIPFIGIDISGEDILQPHDSPLQGNVEKSVQSQVAKVSISKTTRPETVSKVSSAVQVNSVIAELSSDKTSPLGIPETNQLWALGSESDDRCPTPTMDEKPYGYSKTSCSQSCKSPLSGGKNSETVTQRCSRRNSITGKDEKPVEQKPSSMASGDLGILHSCVPDLEARTLRVLQSIDKYLPKLSPCDKPSQIEKADMKQKPQTSNSDAKYILSCLAQNHSSKDFKDQKVISNIKSAAVSAPTSQELQTESSENLLLLPFKKMEEVLGVGLQHKQMDTLVHQHYHKTTEKSQRTSSELDSCHSNQSLPSTACLGTMDLNIDQDRHTTSQANLIYDSRPFSQRPVMAVKPSKSDDSQADCLSKDRLSENFMAPHFPKNKQIKTSLVPSITQTRKCLESKKGDSNGLDNNTQEACDHLSKSSWSHDSKSVKTTFAHQDSLYQHKEKDISKVKIFPSSLPEQTFGSAESLSQLVDGKQSLSNSPTEKLGQTAKENLEIDQRNYSEASTSGVGYEDDDMDESLYLGPNSSLSCTVYNTKKRSYSFLEQVSQRCIQEDPTEASMEQECLIFSEKMKRLMKRCKMGSAHQLDAHSKANLPCPSPVSVQFSGLEEQEESVDHIDDLSLFGQKIKVDMSDRKDPTENVKTPSQGASTPIEHAGVSALTAECAELYEAAMNNVCAIRDAPSKPKHIRTDKSNQKAEPSSYFDFCNQMKREMDESFRSSLNSVVKKSSKTKYRFFILETSDDAFFEETKAQLEAEGHTAVQPSEFLLSDVTPSSLLIILRNEDIAEHICEVPHLLELKKCSGVQFAGIDEPDDVVNLTHQELFTRGGFIMFDRAALEPLSLCDMKKMSEILQELSKTGKWKWMLHYRDSRRIKENARVSAGAKDKKLFLNWCQDAGILEVLPYHECDLMSRDQPDYLTCLIRLQVQNITARYIVFITDSAADSAFESNGIVTMTVSSFLSCSPSEAFSF